MSLEALVAETAASLAAPAALESIRRDPYWPKWDSPWWRMTLLWELGEAARVPRAFAEAMAERLDEHYPRVFPVRPGELPPGKDPYRDVLCHCALGTMRQVLAACGVDVDRRLGWTREWMSRYALPDGGWNCDEAAYLRAPPRSSVVSTLPVLEALLALPDRTAAEDALLDRGTEYLLARRLARSLSKGGALMDPSWLEPTFPRFYDYDVLRGLSFLARWARARGRRLPPEAAAEAVAALRARLAPEGLPAGRRAWQGVGSLQPPDWRRVPSASFPLLERVSAVGAPNPWLTRLWREAEALLA